MNVNAGRRLAGAPHLKKVMRSIVALGFACVMLAGCGSSPPAQTPEDVKKFEGGPMPADFRKQLEERQKQNQASLAAKAQGHGP